VKLTVESCRLVPFGVHMDARGVLVFAEAGDQLPFAVERIFWFAEMSEEAPRAGHAHRTASELLTAVAGRITVRVDDGWERRRFLLDRRDRGLLVPPGIWVDIESPSADAVCLVLASHHYDADDFWTDYGAFEASTRDGT